MIAPGTATDSSDRGRAVPPPSRMAPCPCGSGRRYKHCCGGRSDRLVALDPQRQAALAAQSGGELHTAIAGYRAVLAQAPDDYDVQHMLALCYYQLGCMPEACALFRAVLARWPMPPDAFWTNLNLVVASAAWLPDHPLLQAQRARYLRWQDAIAGAAPQPHATVSVVLPSYRHAAFVAQAIASVRAQTRPPDELIVIDDGSGDDSVAIIGAALADCPIPHRVVSRSNRGADVTLNEAIAMASGDWIAPLNSDDAYDPARLATLLAACAREGIDWGFGGVDIVDASGQALARGNEITGKLYAVHDALHMSEALSLAFLRGNPAISTGNLFFRKSLWQRVGGFAPLRYNHDWAFCLAASMHAEPVWVPAARYRYRWHGGNTIGDSRIAPQREAAAMMQQFVARACVTPDRAERWQAFAPCATGWGLAFWTMLAAGGHVQLAPRGQLLDLLDRLAAATPARPPLPPFGQT